MGLPIVTLGLLTFCMFDADRVGRYVQMLYIIWSPYHYAAQAYGLSVMYMLRSGCVLSLRHKKLLWWIAIIPFFKVLLVSVSRHIVPWLLPQQLLWTDGDWRTTVEGVMTILGILALGLPLVLFVRIWQVNRRAVPLISILVILTNAVWFVVFPLLDGFVWTTIFHGIQYLAIVMVFHVRDRVAQTDNTRSVLYHVLWFYGMCIVIGYALFNCLPFGYRMLGFGAAESLLLVLAAINIHHFIVDGYIWKMGRTDGNRRVVESSTLSAGGA